MPFVEKPRGYGEYIGHGTEKNVFGSSDKNKDQQSTVIKESHADTHDERDFNYVKAQYYLTKILHLLFPKNIPNIHFTTVENGHHVTVEQKIEQDKNPIKNNDDLINFLKERGKLLEKFYDLGIFYDDGAKNFGFDNEGNMIYFDSVNPWRKYIRDDERVLEINELAFKKAIAELPDERQREEAGHFLERLKKLFDKEIEDRNKARQ